jgi:hypothetical protein
MAPIAAGEVVVLHGRGDGLPKEANKIRPYVVVEDRDLFSDEFKTQLIYMLSRSCVEARCFVSIRRPRVSIDGCEPYTKPFWSFR